MDTLQGAAKDDPPKRADRSSASSSERPDSMTRLIDDLLSLSRGRNARTPDAAEHVDLNEAASHVIQTLSRLPVPPGRASS